MEYQKGKYMNKNSIGGAKILVLCGLGLIASIVKGEDTYSFCHSGAGCSVSEELQLELRAYSEFLCDSDAEAVLKHYPQWRKANEFEKKRLKPILVQEIKEMYKRFRTFEFFSYGTRIVFDAYEFERQAFPIRQIRDTQFYGSGFVISATNYQGLAVFISENKAEQLLNLGREHDVVVTFKPVCGNDSIRMKIVGEPVSIDFRSGAEVTTRLQVRSHR